jgi:hypothetical protein
MLMTSTLKKHCHNISISVTNTDVDPEFKGYGNGSGWPQSMLKLKRLRQIVQTYDIKPDDFILSVDSDVVFTSPEVFKHVNPEYGIIGTKHRPDFHTALGMWSHMSGALIFIRGDIAKKMSDLTDVQLDHIRYQHFKTNNLTENEDVVLSYLASVCGANYFDLGTVPGLTSGDFESEVWTENENKFGVRSFLKSFYHLNYCPTEFLGRPVVGKWSIPSVLKEKGIEL